MNCPKCEGKLKQKLFNNVSIHECDSCFGMWFDKEELNRAKDSTDEDLRWLDFDIFEQKQNKYFKKESSRVCPRDESKLKTFTYFNSKISIEVCSMCQGIWLDSEEFERIIKYLEDKVVSETSGDYAKELARQFGEMLKDPSHLGSEAKDFIAVLKLAGKRVEAEHPDLTYALSNFPIR